MIRFKSSETQTAISNEDVALCQRVYDHVLSVKQITRDAEREDLGKRTIQLFQQRRGRIAPAAELTLSNKADAPGTSIATAR